MYIAHRAHYLQNTYISFGFWGAVPEVVYNICQPYVSSSIALGMHYHNAISPLHLSQCLRELLGFVPHIQRLEDIRILLCWKQVKYTTDASIVIISMIGEQEVWLNQSLSMIVVFHLFSAKQYPNILHSLDVWHKSKKLVKALTEVQWTAFVIAHTIIDFMICVIHSYSYPRARTCRKFHCGWQALWTTSGTAAQRPRGMLLFWR